MSEQGTTQSRPIFSRALLIAACAALLSLALPALASAKPHGGVTRLFEFELKTRGSHGYSIDVFSGADQKVRLLAHKGPFDALYEVRGHVTRKRVTANFGKLGQISLRFKPRSKESRSLDGGCRPIRITEERGTFRGALVFNGEQGFTGIKARRLRGEMEHTVIPRCGRRARAGASPGPEADRAAPADGVKAAALAASARSHGRRIGFVAVKVASESDEWVLAGSLGERRGRVEIEKEVTEFADPDAVVLSKRGVHPATADVTSPKPFRGSAHFTEEPVPPALAWDGTLSVSFPGIGPIGLAGSGFEAFLCNKKNLEAVFECLFESAESPTPRTRGFADPR